MKILYLTNLYPTKKSPGGGVFITKRIEALKRLGVDVCPYAVVHVESPFLKAIKRILSRPLDEENQEKYIYAPDSDVAYEKLVIKTGLAGKLLNHLSYYRYTAWKAALKLSKEAKSKDFDILHAHWLYPTGRIGVKAARLLKLPSVVTCHGSDVNVIMGSKRGRKPSLKVLQTADRVEFVSRALYNKASEYGYNLNNWTVVPNGIDSLPDFPERDSHKDIKTVGFVGNLIEIKRADELPGIIKNICHKYLGKVRFYIVGQGALRECMEKELNGFPVTFFGQVEHRRVLKLMNEMDVMILPSKNEGWPCVVLEAHSVGTPVVGSSNGGIPEAVGDENFIVPEGDGFNERFAQKVTEILEGRFKIDENQLKSRAYEFCWDKLQQRSIDIYKQLIDRKDS